MASQFPDDPRWSITRQVVRSREDGGVSLSFRVDGLDEIVHWVLGWTGKVSVVRPEELRRRVAAQLLVALKLNGREVTA